MKIAAGSLRGRALRVPDAVRPTSGRTREALFSRWQARLPACRFLDLFAGSGAVGIEAISRGASEAVLVEESAGVVRVLEANVEALAPGRCTVLRSSLPATPGGLERRAPFGLVFADPPYAFASYPELLVLIAGLLDPAGAAAVEHSRRADLGAPPPGLVPTAERTYGESRLSFFEIE